ncbi:MAG: ABC transporter substrate-binding protein [Candidatus Zixiibacteriota bacterium]
MRKFSRFLFALLALSLLLSGCAQKENQNEILIGAYLSLTGTTATFGTSTLEGIQMAVDKTNAAGGIMGKQIHLLSEDTQSKPEEAALAVTKLITRDKVCAILGEIASSRTLAAAPIAQQNKVPMVTPGSTNPEVTKKGDYIFRVCYIDPFQGEVMARFTYETLGLHKVAVIKDVKNDYSIGLAQFFTEVFTKLGGQVIGEQAYSEGDTDFRAQLTAIKGLKPEAIIVPGYYQESALLVKQARDLNMNMPFVGGDGWDSSKLIEVGGAAMNGTYFTNHYAADDTLAVVQEFVNAYKQRFGGNVPDAMAVLGYDAALILFDAIARAGSDNPAKIRDALSGTVAFPGVSGTTTIDADRNALKPIVVVMIENEQIKLHTKISPQ